MPVEARPVIGFLTDFGFDGAAAICRGVMLSIARDAQIVDISHSVGKYGIGEGAYLLWATLPWLPVGVHVAVVDPGVGTDRRPIGLRVGRGDVLVGPDNGLLLPAARRLGGVSEARLLENREWILPQTSATFHGRDIFAPVAAHLATGARFEEAGRAIAAADLVDLVFPAPVVDSGLLTTAVIHVDSFGNLRLAAGVAELTAALGEIEPGTRLEIDLPDSTRPRDEHARFWRTFGESTAGDLLAYEDSSGNLALAESRGNAARRLAISAGARLRIRRA
jgi:S-adenosyl-L-methionine hydrolase (adenosine-forming)